MKRLCILVCFLCTQFAAAQIISEGVDALLANAVASNQKYFYAYERSDSGFNNAVASGLFASSSDLITPSALEPSCIFDPTSPNGCNPDAKSYDRNGTWIRLIVPPLPLPGQFFGLNLEEPDHYGTNRIGKGLDLRGVQSVSFFAASTSPSCQVIFGVHGSVSQYFGLPTMPGETPYQIPLASLNPPVRRLDGVHLLFTIATDSEHCPAGGSILVTKVQFTPTPSIQASMLSFPLANETFGINPLRVPTCQDFANVTVPPDQVNRNLTSIYESSLSLIWLISRQEYVSAKQIADAFVYALSHPNTALPLPPRPGRTNEDDPNESQPPAILNNGYMSGDLAFSDDQPTGDAAGEARLAGFSGGEPTSPQFCLVLDGATGGNNAFAMLALTAASRHWGGGADGEYLVSARRIAKWIDRNLTDDNNYGGFFIGWNDGGDRSPVGFLRGKSVENNADIYAAMKVLADRERETGDKYGLAGRWAQLAIHAGNFVMRMFKQEQNGSAHFYAGTVPCTQPANPGIIPERACTETGSEVRNIFDFLDATTFVGLAMAGSDDYRNKIDWRLPLRWSMSNQAVSVSRSGVLYKGFDLVTPLKAAAVPAGVKVQHKQGKYMPGIAWEFTGQAVVTMRLIDSIYSTKEFSAAVKEYLQGIEKVHQFDEFGDQKGIVASTIDETPNPANHGIDLTAPYNQCLPTPFQCIASRVGLAASLWGAFAEEGFNPLARPASGSGNP